MIASFAAVINIIDTYLLYCKSNHEISQILMSIVGTMKSNIYLNNSPLPLLTPLPLPLTFIFTLTLTFFRMGQIHNRPYILHGHLPKTQFRLPFHRQRFPARIRPRQPIDQTQLGQDPRPFHLRNDLNQLQPIQPSIHRRHRQSTLLPI